MGNWDARIVATIRRKLLGQRSRGPSGVCDQSFAATSAAISPTAAESGSGGGLSVFVLNDMECRKAIVQARIPNMTAEVGLRNQLGRLFVPASGQFVGIEMAGPLS